MVVVSGDFFCRSLFEYMNFIFFFSQMEVICISRSSSTIKIVINKVLDRRLFSSFKDEAAEQRLGTTHWQQCKLKKLMTRKQCWCNGTFFSL